MNDKTQDMKAAKKLAIVTASLGAGFVITKAVQLVCPAGGNLLDKAGAMIGSTVLSAMVAEKASKFAGEKVDLAIQEIEKRVAVEVIPAEEESAEA